MSCNSAFGERFDFDLVTIPTDLVATIVNIEDDIRLNNQPQTNTRGSTTTAVAVEDSVSSTEPALTAKLEKSNDTPPSSSGSIFSETSSVQIIEPVEPVTEPDKETVTVALAKNTTVIADTPTLAENEQPEEPLPDTSFIASVTTEEPAKAQQQVPEATAMAEVKNQNETTSSIFDNVTTDQNETPLLVVDKPLSASDAADMSTTTEESQGVIVIADEASDAKTEVAIVSAPPESAPADNNTVAALDTESDQTDKSPEDAVTTATQTETVAPSSDKTTELAADQIAAVEPAEPAQAETQTETRDQAKPQTIQKVVTAAQEEAINEDEIIIAWATAWSNNLAEDYLAFYADAFVPADKSLDRKAWEKQRRKRLKNKKIRIIVSNAEVFRVEGDVTEVRFTQRYTSASYKDRVIKSIEMTKTDKGWQFLSERTIKKLPFE